MIKCSIFCASSDAISPGFKSKTAKLADYLNRQNVKILCGGGNGGLMKILANQSIANKAPIQGIMPHSMAKHGWDNKDIEDFIYTDSIEERKSKLIHDADFIITLPGGTGTLEELFDAITLKKIGEYIAPIFIYNMDEYYNGLLSWLDRAQEEGMMKEKDLHLWQSVDNQKELEQKLSKIIAGKKTKL